MKCPDCNHDLMVITSTKDNIREKLGYYCDYCTFQDPDNSGKFFELTDKRLIAQALNGNESSED